MRALALVSGRARARAQAQLSDLALVQLSTRMRPDGRKAARIRVAIAGGAAEARGLPGSRCLVRSWLVRRAVQVPGLGLAQSFVRVRARGARLWGRSVRICCQGSWGWLQGPRQCRTGCRGSLGAWGAYSLPRRSLHGPDSSTTQADLRLHGALVLRIFCQGRWGWLQGFAKCRTG